MRKPLFHGLLQCLHPYRLQFGYKRNGRIDSCSHEKSEEDGYDYISNLQESVMSQILPRLPFKEAVQTSILSKEWEFKWTCLSDVKFDDEAVQTMDEQAVFANFIDRVLFLTDNLTSFQLTTSISCWQSRLITWITTALEHKVERLEIVYQVRNNDDIVYFPHYPILTMNLLRILKLVLHCTLNFDDFKSCTFPNLTSLYLERVRLLKGNSNTALSLFFPVLEEFVTMWCEWMNVNSVEIHAPALTSFSCHTLGRNLKEYSIKIFAPKLVKFESGDSLPENIVLDGGSEVVSASLHNWHDLESDWLIAKIGPQVTKLLSGFSSLENLALSGLMAKAFRSGGLPCRGYYSKLRRLLLIGPLKAN